MYISIFQTAKRKQITILHYMDFMEFVKFYRRFTLENYMALLTEKNNP